MVRLIALRPLAMDRMYHPGEIFEIEKNTALELEKRGLVERWQPPEDARVVANKILKPPENKIVEPEEYKIEMRPPIEPIEPEPKRKRGRPKLTRRTKK